MVPDHAPAPGRSPLPAPSPRPSRPARAQRPMEPVLGFEPPSPPPPQPRGGAPRSLPAERARTLLRKLRDLDLRARRVEVHGGLLVRIDGCLSADVPVEDAVRYRLAVLGGGERVLGIRWREGELELELSGEGGPRLRRIELLLDDAGRAAAPAIGARMDPDSASRREVEHFLRRLLRSAFNGA